MSGVQFEDTIECDVCAGREPAKRSRADYLGCLVAGDIFSADGLLFLVVSLDAGLIHARRLIVPEERTFDRASGEDVTQGSGGARSPITSVEPLPPDVHNMILWLDRKNRLLSGMSQAKLKDAEKKALLFVSDHHAANPI